MNKVDKKITLLSAPIILFFLSEYDNCQHRNVSERRFSVFNSILQRRLHQCQVSGNVFRSLYLQGIGLPIRSYRGKGCRMVHVATSYTDTCVHQSNVNTITQLIHVASWCSLQLVYCDDHCIRLIFWWSSMGHTRLVKVSYFVFQKYHSKEEF